IYQHQNLTIEYHPNEQARFKGDEADLTEMLGNVLDNACKAAKTKVTLTLTQQDSQLCMTIEDDGDGIPKDPQQDVCEGGIRA
ncbi:ATP-binding protein, partial [Shewanella sp. S1-49-MNA-CIBAN-0167]|uniref:ATP-binding protein n=1 Tax=Shewanella sp. S1-49-MNA-CIBAN-0167 TaxID=3140468 RepID=UPI0033272D9C